MATKNISDTMYDGSPRELSLTKGNEGEQPHDYGNFTMSNDEYLSEILARIRPTRSEILRDAYESTLMTPAAAYNGDVEGFGTSRFDKRVSLPEQLDDLEDTRARMQTTLGKLANSVPKMATLAATTFVDSYIGTLAGIGNVIQGLSEGNIHSWKEGWHAFIDNPISQELQGINEWSQRVFKNYQTNDERNREWWQNMGTANFWADNILTNAGFIIGAAFAGKTSASMMGKALNVAERKNAFLGLTQELGDAAKGKTPSQVLRALQSGTMDGKALEVKSAQLMEDLAKKAKDMKNANIAMKAAGTIMAASGEARIESINAMNEYEESLGNPDDLRLQARLDAVNELYEAHPDWFEYTTTQTGGKYLQCVNPAGQQLLQAKYDKIDATYNQYKVDMEQNKAMVGNTVFGINMALLSIGDLVQFGKMFTGEFETGRLTAKGLRKKMISDTAKKAEKEAATTAIDRLAATTYEGAGKGVTFKRKLLGGVKNAFVEGQEEMNQSWASSMAKYKGTNQVGEFTERLYDPEGQDRSVKFFNALAEGWKQSWGNKEDWVEGFAGAFMGAFGLPSIEMKYNARKGTMRKGIVMHGGMWDAIRAENTRSRLQNMAADELNKRLQDPAFKAYYYGLVGRNSIDESLEKAIQDGDKEAYMKYSDMQLVSDMVMFSEAGRLQDFIDMIDSLATNATTDETINAVKKALGNEALQGMDNETLREQIGKNAKDMQDLVKKYRKVSNDLQVLYGNTLQEDDEKDKHQLSEMIWTTIRLDRINDRINELTEKMGTQAGAYRQYRQDNGLTALVDEENNPLNDLELLTSKEYKDYLASQKVEGKKDATLDSISKNADKLSYLYNLRSEYMDMLSQLSDDPELISRKMLKLNKDRGESKTQAETSAALKKLKDIRKYSDLVAYLDENGDITRDVRNILEDARGKGDKQAEFVLRAMDVDKSVRDLIKERLSEKAESQDKLSADIADMQEAWRKHIAEAESLDEMLTEISNKDGAYKPEFIDTLNEIIRSQREAVGNRPESTPSQQMPERHMHPFAQFAVDKDHVYYAKDDAGNVKALRNKGSYFMDMITSEVFEKDGTRVGVLYSDEAGTKKVNSTTAGFSYKRIGQVKDAGIMPWDSRWNESQKQEGKPQPSQPMAQPAPQQHPTPQRKPSNVNPFTRFQQYDRISYTDMDGNKRKGTIQWINAAHELGVLLDGDTKITNILPQEAGNVRMLPHGKQAANPQETPQSGAQQQSPEQAPEQAPEPKPFRLTLESVNMIDSLSELIRELRTTGKYDKAYRALPPNVELALLRLGSRPENMDEFAKWNAAAVVVWDWMVAHPSNAAAKPIFDILDPDGKRHELAPQEVDETPIPEEKPEEEPKPSEPEQPAMPSEPAKPNVFGFVGQAPKVTFKQPQKDPKKGKRKDGSEKTAREEQKENDCKI